MLYLGYQAHADLMQPIRAMANAAAVALRRPLNGSSGQTLVRRLAAAHELLARTGLTHTRPPFGIGTVEVAGREVAVREEAALINGFGTLLHFAKDVDA